MAAGIRVHELAKEFGMQSKELLDILKEMNVPVKSHSSTLPFAYVDRIRKKLADKIETVSPEDDTDEIAKAEEEKKKAEEAKRKKAADKEKKAREQELAAKGKGKDKAEDESEETSDAELTEPPEEEKESEPKVKAPVKIKKPSKITLTIIEEPPTAPEPEQEPEAEPETAPEPVQKPKQEATPEPKPEPKPSSKANPEVAPKQEAAPTPEPKPEPELKPEPEPEPAPAPKPEPEPKKKIPTKVKPQLSSLLSQIEAQEEELKKHSEAKAAKEEPKTHSAPKKGKRGERTGETETTEKREGAGSTKSKAPKKGTAKFDASGIKLGTDSSEDGTGKSGKKGPKKKGELDLDDEQIKKPAKGTGKGGKKKISFSEDGIDDDENDRYAQMAAKAEQLQKNKVIEEAKAHVAAASGQSEGKRKERKEKREAEALEKAQLNALEKGLDPDIVLDDTVVKITTGATVSEFAAALGVSGNEIIKKLFLLGVPLTLTQTISDELIELIADDMERKVHISSPDEDFMVVVDDDEKDLVPRSPVVTVMGHVDHGKTSLLDAIRSTGVVDTEAGGITQHIGASVVKVGERQITFIDTPGHEAFTAMRARGAEITDVVVLVVAADDGVMPQTIEAIDHSKAAGVPIVVAVNKIDKPGADTTRVRSELSEHGIISEEWGGQNMFVEVSAKKKLNIDELLETILLASDVLELRANPNTSASGFVIEANLDKGRGSVATVLVNRGTLNIGDYVVTGTAHGRVRALIDPHGDNVKHAKPADPVEIVGLNSVPQAGDDFRVFEDEREARNLAESRAMRERLAGHRSNAPVTLDDFYARVEEGKIVDLNLIVKADVQGSIEALKDALDKMDQSEVRIRVIHSAVGGVTETDVILAAASDAIIIAFGVRPSAQARNLAEKEKVDIRAYRVIYQALEDINAARVGLLSPDIIEEEKSMVEVREIYKVPKIGFVCGCFVEEGEVGRNDKVRIVRDGTIVFDGKIASLRRFKDDATSVKAGFECGIGIEGFQDVKVGDILESYVINEVARKE